MMYHIVNLFSSSDCFLCNFFEAVRSFFVYEESKPSSNVGTVHRTSPFDHIIQYHGWLIWILFLLTLLVIIAIIIIRAARSQAASAANGSTQSGSASPVPLMTANVKVTLYGFKTVGIPPSAEYYPDIPSREGYAFTGWFYDPSFTKPFMPGKKLKKDITLYPRWQKE